MVDGKAELLRDDYCDGLGDCLPACPTGAISFVEREAAEYDEAAVMENNKKKGDKNTRSHDHTHAHGGCPGSRMRQMSPRPVEEKTSKESVSQLAQWPCQIKLVPVNAPYFDGAKLLIAADCTAYAYGRFHQDFIRNRIVLIGCPKLDDTDYSLKLTDILAKNEIRSVTVVRMEVPCCGGISYAAEKAIARCGKKLPMQIITIGTDGEICR